MYVLGFFFQISAIEKLDKLGLYYEKNCYEISTLSKSPFCKSLPKQTTNNRLKHINILD